MERQYGLVSLSTFFGVTKASVDKKKTGFGGEKVWQKKRVSPTIDKEHAVDADWGNFHYQLRGSVVYSNNLLPV